MYVPTGTCLTAVVLLVCWMLRRAADAPAHAWGRRLHSTSPTPDLSPLSPALRRELAKRGFAACAGCAPRKIADFDGKIQEHALLDPQLQSFLFFC